MCFTGSDAIAQTHDSDVSFSFSFIVLSVQSEFNHRIYCRTYSEYYLQHALRGLLKKALNFGRKNVEIVIVGREDVVAAADW